MPKGSMSTAGKAAAQAPMIAKLRRKLVVTHMLFAIIALVVVGVVIVCFYHGQQELAVYNALDRALALDERQGDFDPGAHGPLANGGETTDASQSAISQGMPDYSATSSTDSDDVDDSNDADDADADDDDLEEMFVGPQDDDDDLLKPGGPIRQSSSDAFVATSVYYVDTNKVATVRIDSLSLDSQTAQSALSLAVEQASAASPQEAQGKISSLGLYYRAKSSPDGSMRVAFASANYVNQTMAPLIRSLALAGALALVGFLIVSVVLARWSVRPVERAWKQQQQFVADASHELKTPLAVILANNSLLMSDPQATVASQMQWVESTETEAHLMQGLVNDMLYLAQSEGEHRVERCEAVDFSDIVEGVALQFESVAFEREVVLESEIDAGVIVKGDPTRLQRLAGTLVDNACKYANEGGRVMVGLSDQGSSCQLRVTNTGAAIDPDDLPHLFDRFYRSDKARTRGAGGFGLGLSIAKSIVDDLGGHISVSSTAEEGTTFVVHLPQEGS